MTELEKFASYVKTAIQWQTPKLKAVLENALDQAYQGKALGNRRANPAVAGLARPDARMLQTVRDATGSPKPRRYSAPIPMSKEEERRWRLFGPKSSSSSPAGPPNNEYALAHSIHQARHFPDHFLRGLERERRSGAMFAGYHEDARWRAALERTIPGALDHLKLRAEIAQRGETMPFNARLLKPGGR